MDRVRRNTIACIIPVSTSSGTNPRTNDTLTARDPSPQDIFRSSRRFTISSRYPSRGSKCDYAIRRDESIRVGSQRRQEGAIHPWGYNTGANVQAHCARHGEERVQSPPIRYVRRGVAAVAVEAITKDSPTLPIVGPVLIRYDADRYLWSKRSLRQRLFGRFGWRSLRRQAVRDAKSSTHSPRHHCRGAEKEQEASPSSGFSLGDGIAMAFAADFPYLLNSIVLLAPGGIIRRLPAEYESLSFRYLRFLPPTYQRRLVDGKGAGPRGLANNNNNNNNNRRRLSRSSWSE